MSSTAPMTPRKPMPELAIMVSYLCMLVNQDALPEVRLKDLHPELVRAGMHPVMETTTLFGAVENLMGLPGLDNTGVVSFVIRGEAVITAEYLVLLSREFEAWNRTDLTALLHDAQPGNRVAVIGVSFNQEFPREREQ